MKRYNHRKTITAVLTAALLLAACAKSDVISDIKPPIPAGMGEVTLGEIRLSEAEAALSPEASAATRATVENLPAGATLRLYAFNDGVTNFSNKLATRTYTVDASGLAVLDAGQEPLYLPIGDVDIYLVGPTQRNLGTVMDPVWTEVAGPWGVFPHQGVDLIAAYTPATINPGAVNPLPAMTLRHKMSRVQVVVSRHDQAAYENLVVKDIKIYDQPVEGTYAFDASGGVITPATTLSTFSYPQITEETPHEKYSGTTVLIPTPEKDVKIETTFACNQIGVDGDTHPTLTYRQSGWISAALPSGAATRFTTAPLTPVEIKWRVKLLPWDTVDQGEIVIPSLKDGLILCFEAPSGLSGGDASGNGAKWIDIFGRELTAFVPASSSPAASITYSQTDKAIVFSGPVYSNQGTRMNGNFDIGSYNELSLEFVYQSKNGYLNFLADVYDVDGKSSLWFRPNTGGSSLGIHLTTTLTSDSNHYYELGAPSAEQSCVVYAISGKDGTFAIYRNGALLFSKTITSTTTGEIDLKEWVVGNKKSGNQAFTGNLYALRVYNKVLTAEHIKANYDRDRTVFNFQ